MKDLLIVSAIALGLMAAAAGCGRTERIDSDVRALVRHYDRTWNAVAQVMSDHFLIKTTDKSEGLVIAAPLRNDGRMGQAETRVSAKIFPSRTGGYEVEIRAAQYVEISEPRALSNKTPRYTWAPVSFDKKLETQLLNEIDNLRYGGRKPKYENKFLESPGEAALNR